VESSALDDARVLLAEYREWVIAASRTAGLDPETLRSHYFHDDSLLGPFAPPDGCLLLARAEGEPIGIVGFERLDDRACEMKRLYVRPSGRGLGAARALVTRLLEEAHSYEEMRLETRTFMPEAIALYASLGFAPCAAFHEIPESFRAATRFLSRRFK
jgi:ribosomal protein S18 acetylase RimI-like enzyme